MTGMHELAYIGQRLGKALSPGTVLQPVGRKLHRPVARGHPHYQTATGKLVDGRGCLGQINRVTQGDDGAARCQGHSLGSGRQVGQIGEGIEHLPCISKRWIEQRHITHPYRCKSVAVDLGDQVRLAAQHRHIAAVTAQRQKDA